MRDSLLPRHAAGEARAVGEAGEAAGDGDAGAPRVRTHDRIALLALSATAAATSAGAGASDAAPQQDRGRPGVGRRRAWLASASGVAHPAAHAHGGAPDQAGARVATMPPRAPQAARAGSSSPPPRQIQLGGSPQGKAVDARAASTALERNASAALDIFSELARDGADE